jgi:hypothetical protein
LAEDKGKHDKGTLYFILHAAGCGTVHCSLHPFALTPPSPSPGGAAAHAHPHRQLPKPAARRHTLRTAGWTALPDHVSAFANEFAMPGTFTD